MPEDWQDDLDASDSIMVVVEDAALPNAGETVHGMVRWEVEEAARGVGVGLDGGVLDYGPDVEVGGFTYVVCACAVVGDVYACSMEGAVESWCRIGRASGDYGSAFFFRGLGFVGSHGSAAAADYTLNFDAECDLVGEEGHSEQNFCRIHILERSRFSMCDEFLNNVSI